VGFKSFSQIVIQSDSVVILTENQARNVAKDLVRYGFSLKVIEEQELRVKNFQIKEIEFNNLINSKDSLIFYQRNIIDNQNKIIKRKKPLELHGYLGVQSFQIQLIEPVIYGNLMVEFSRFNLGAQYLIQVNSKNKYGIILEYKIF
tara:strand:- start:705 stop:1142 length:438 start_codon:yes stop_codon:yes gene_type:complete